MTTLASMDRAGSTLRHRSAGAGLGRPVSATRQVWQPFLERRSFEAWDRDLGVREDEWGAARRDRHNGGVAPGHPSRFYTGSLTLNPLSSLDKSL